MLQNFRTSRWTRPQHSLSTATFRTETFDAYQNRIYELISAPTIATSFSFRGLVKERLICVVSCPSGIGSLFVTIPSHTSTSLRHHVHIMYEVVDGSLRKICNYQRNVPQHCYLLDTLATSIFLQKMKTPVLLPTLNFFKNKLGIDKKKIRELVTFQLFLSFCKWSHFYNFYNCNFLFPVTD